MTARIHSNLVVRFEGLDRFSDQVVVDLSKSLTSIVGPNGSGKSTVLEAVAQVMTFLHHYAVEAPVEEVRGRLSARRSANPAWSRAEVEITLSEAIKVGSTLRERLNEDDEVRTVSLVVAPRPEHGRWALAAVHLGSVRIEFDLGGSIIVDSRRKAEIVAKRQRYEEEWQQQSQETEEQIGKIRQDQIVAGKRSDGALTAQLDAQYRELKAHLHTREKEHTQRLAAWDEELRHATASAIPLASGVGEVAKSDIEGLWSALALPKVTYLHGAADIANLIQRLTVDLARLKAQRHSEVATSSFNRLRTAIEALLRMHVTIETSDEPTLLIDERPVQEVSTGTWHALGFAAISEGPETNGLVIWDEPETALHPTWARKVCDLMLASQTRRFLVATHRTEFVPLGESCLRAYATRAGQHARGSKAWCGIKERTEDLTEAIALAATLGLEPSRILFTTNAVLWVEGPSDVVCWRMWLSHRAHERGISLVEGFDYAFMLSAGSLLAHSTVTDDAELPKGAVNLLHLVGASRVIVDADADLTDLVDHGLQSNGRIREDVLARLKPRVRKIAQAIRSLGDGNLSTLACSWGRELENSYSDEALQKVLEKLTNSQNHNAAPVVVPRWRSYQEVLNDARHPAAAAACDKMRLAQAYLEVAAELKDSGLREQARGLVDETIDWIVQVRDRYVQ